MKIFGKKKLNEMQNNPNLITGNVERIERGMNSVADIIAPSSIEVDFGHVRVGEKFHKTFFVSGYPRFVSPNWLEPLIDFDHSLNISMFIYPTTSADILED